MKRRALRMIRVMKSISYKSNLVGLVYQNKGCKGTAVYNYTRELLTGVKMKYEVETLDTRINGYELLINKSEWEIRRFPSIRAMRFWNSIPTGVVGAKRRGFK